LCFSCSNDVLVDRKRRQIMPSDCKTTRRAFLAGASTVATFTFVSRHVIGGPGQTPPSDRLNIAGVGVGGMGHHDIQRVGNENIFALCDVDAAHAAKSFRKFPKAKVYKDFRVMFDKEKSIDAVMTATPDHNHAVVTMAALKRGKHVYCQKPLTHSVYEAREVAKAAKEAGVATQMGNQGQATESARVLQEMVMDGAVGNVLEIHGWTNRKRFITPRGLPRPKGNPPVPKTLEWDLWLGPAPHRPYNPAYLPFRWRGWWDFGTGVLGDIGCHNFSSIFKALKLGAPSTIEACSSNDQASEEIRRESAPVSSIVRFTFPEKDGRAAVKLTWWDGGMMPPHPEELESNRKMGGGDGMLYIGDKGKILGHRLIPEKRMKEYGRPPKVLPRSPGHYREWIEACKGGKPAGSNFVDHAGALAEIVLLGNIAIRTRKRLEWDPVKMCFPNAPDANAYINPPYREGWSL